MKKYCKEYLIKCPYKCADKVKRKDLSNHLRDKPVMHLEQLRNHTNERFAHLQLELQIRDKEIEALKEKARRSATGFTAEWVIDWPKDISRYFESKVFELHGFRWYLGMYTDGEKPENKGYISIFLYLKAENGKVYDKKAALKKIHLGFEFEIINHKNTELNIKKKFDAVFPVVGSHGWGEQQALERRVLCSEGSGYLLENCVHIHFHASPEKITAIL